MLVAAKNLEDLKNLEEFASVKNQVEGLHLQENLGKQNFHENVKKEDSLIEKIKDTSEILTKTITETYFNNNKAIENLNEKFLELMNDKGMIAPFLASSLVNFYKPENKNQFRLIKDLNQLR